MSDVDLSRFYLGKEVFWISIEDNKLKINSGLIENLYAEYASLVQFKKKWWQWDCFADMGSQNRYLRNLFHSKQEALDHLNKQVSML